MSDESMMAYSTRGWVKVPADKIWAPCLHKPEDKEKVAALLTSVLGEGAEKFYDPLFTEKSYNYDLKNKDGSVHSHHEGVSVRLNPRVTEGLLWKLSELPGLELSFYSDQWVGISTVHTGPDGKKDGTWIEGDDFTLALAKTIEVWEKKLVAQG